MRAQPNSTAPSNRSLILPLCCAAAVFLLGTAVYLLDRAPLNVLTALQWRLPMVRNHRVFGPLGLNFPSFAHAYCFTVLLIVALGLRIPNIVGASVGWLVVESLFEIGQHPAVCRQFVAVTARWHGSSRLLRVAVRYLSAGVFDPHDLAAIAAGVGLGVVTVLICKQGDTACKRKNPG